MTDPDAPGLDASTSFGELLRRRRLAAGLTQEALAERADLSPRSVRGLERGESRPYRETARRLADALGLSSELRAAFAAAAGPAPRERGRERSDGNLTFLFAGSASPPHNLPAPLTRLVGPATELAEVVRLLGGERSTGQGSRLVTLTGPGGAGKTRLAVEAARHLAGLLEACEDTTAFADGVWLVELAALADGERVPAAVARVVDVTERGGRPPLAALAEALRGRRLLLVLDNCEHLQAACAGTAEALLRACPGVRILATSRQPLAIPGEIVRAVPPLAAPPADDVAADPAAMLGFPAVELFVERASAAAPGFSLGPDNAAGVARVCRQLDGLPLALELAAARVAGLAIPQLAARLDGAIQLLVSSSRSAAARQRTLRDAIAWSHELLSPAERILFRRLARFAGGWSIEAVEAVCAGPDLAADGTLDALLGLVDQSVVVAETAGESARYRLLETVRAYAAERLDESGEADAVARRHVDWCVGLVEEAAPAIYAGGVAGAGWLDRLDVEHNNLRAALTWSVRVQGGEAATIGLRLGAALWQFWAIRGHWNEGREWLARLLAAESPTGEPTRRARAWSLHGAGVLAWTQADYVAGRALLEESLGLFRELGDERAVAETLSRLGMALYALNDSRRARALLEESVAAARACGDRRVEGKALGRLGWIHDEPGPRKRQYYEECLAVSGSAGHLRDTSGALDSLGQAALACGELAAARAYLEKALTMRRQLRDRRGVAYSLFSLAGVALERGDHASARAAVHEGLETCHRANDRWGTANALHVLGRAAARDGDLGHAAALVGRAVTLYEEVGERRLIASALDTLGDLARRGGDLAGADELFGRATALRVGLDDHENRVYSLYYRGRLALDRGRAQEASSLLKEGLAAMTRFELFGSVPRCLEALAGACAATGAVEHAGRLLGAAEAMRAAMGTPLPSADRAENVRLVEALRASLGDPGLNAARSEGKRRGDRAGVAGLAS
jgi:predicted ATPase/transcriptional regulator with XRE-family HTH domain